MDRTTARRRWAAVPAPAISDTVAVDAAGDVIVTGYTDTATLSDILTVKFSGATGTEIWRQRFDDAASGFDQAWALALDGDGNAIVTGYAWSGSEYDIKVIKYASADGAILWQTQFSGLASGIDFGIAIGVDRAGNVIVGGNVWNGTDDDMVTVKFAAADGAVLWSRTFAGAAGAGDYVFALKVDGDDNVIVTGEATASFGSTSDWKTIKYAAADGAVLWETSYAGAGNGLDIPYGIAVDAANNVIIAGDTHNGTDLDAKIVKYGAVNGAVLWEQTFAGVGGGDDIFYALALDAAGDAVATGFTFNGVADNDWNTVKYRGADGVQVWATTFAGSGNLHHGLLPLAWRRVHVQAMDTRRSEQAVNVPSFSDNTRSPGFRRRDDLLREPCRHPRRRALQPHVRSGRFPRHRSRQRVRPPRLHTRLTGIHSEILTRGAALEAWVHQRRSAGPCCHRPNASGRQPPRPCHRRNRSSRTGARRRRAPSA